MFSSDVNDLFDGFNSFTASAPVAQPTPVAGFTSSNGSAAAKKPDEWSFMEKQ